MLIKNHVRIGDLAPSGVVHEAVATRGVVKGSVYVGNRDGAAGSVGRGMECAYRGVTKPDPRDGWAGKTALGRQPQLPLAKPIGEGGERVSEHFYFMWSYDWYLGPLYQVLGAKVAQQK